MLIIDAVSVNEIDASGDQMLRDYYRRLTESGINVLFTRVRKPILKMFERSHMYEDVGREFFHRNPADVYRHAWELIFADTAQAEDEPASNEVAPDQSANEPEAS